MSRRNSPTDDSSLLRQVGTRLQDARRTAALTQDEVATALRVTSESVSRWENGKNAPPITQVVHLAKLYDVSVDWLVGLASHESGLRIGHTVVDEASVQAIRTAAAAGLSLSSVSDFVRPPGVAYAWDIPGQPKLLTAQAAATLHAEIRGALDVLEKNTHKG